MNVAPDTPALDVEMPAALDGERVDRALSIITGLPRRVVADMVSAGQVTIDGRIVTLRSTSLRAGQRLQALLPAPVDTGPRADASVRFEVVFEDDDLIVVDKPAGLVVHHGAGHNSGTLVDGLAARYRDLARLGAEGVGDPERPGIVHRLDKGTSGLLVVARSPEAFHSLSQQFREHSAERRYVALVVGAVAADRGVVEAPIGRSARQPDRMTVSARGRPARTLYDVRARFDQPVSVTLVEATLETGRTHQVRVHLDAIGHPVVGDDRYGSNRARPPELMGLLGPQRLFLHAWQLTVRHPDGRLLSWESSLPAELAAVLAELSRSGSGGS
ncbi:MAG TPA: RluA family pseudouridine synthase [Acidimicrobiales bacterium]|nr:RluA family pseudouridine synthase [Acidimicrobiales bacterium]